MSFYKQNKKIIDKYECNYYLKDLALLILRPTASWTILNNETITWYDKEQIQPTEEEINDIKNKLIKEYPLYQLRKKRDQILKDTDIYFTISDYPIDENKKEELKNYRKELRDLPNYLEDNNIEIDIDNLEQYFPIKPIYNIV